jgi:hypothetical protein
MQDASSNLPLYIVPFFVIGLIFFICYFISFVSGWFTLSRRFTKQAEPYGETRTVGPFFYTVYLRFWGHYSSVIRMTATAESLYLSVMFLFRIGHPPLSIPWTEIHFSRTRFFFRRYIVLTLGLQERIPLRISERMARNLGILDRLPPA